MKYVFSLIFVLVVVCLSFSVVHRQTFLYLAADERVDDVKEMIFYVNGDELLSLETLRLMSDEEIIHMSDVRFTFGLFYSFFLLLIWVLLALWMTLDDVRKTTLFACRIGSVALIVLGVLFYVAFDTVFLWFHEIVFFNDYWLLPADSYLITLFPQATFVNITVATFISSIATLGLLWMWLHASIQKQGERNA